LASNWQPIETAPKDGTIILIYEPPYLDFPDAVGVMYTVVWGASFGYHTWAEANGETYMTFDRSTHWMPLPAPPVTEGEN